MEGKHLDLRSGGSGDGGVGLLVRAARWAEGEPTLVGPALAVYRRRHQLDDVALAGYLGCDLRKLWALAVCRRPSRPPRAPADEDELQRLAAYFGCDAGRLAALIEEASGG